MPYERADAVVIRAVDYSDTSCIYSLYTREFGRMSALAKGAKRKGSKVAGNVDLFAHTEVVFASRRGRDQLHILTEASAYESFRGIRKRLPAYYAACHAAELVNAMTAQEDPSPEMFDRLLALLRSLERRGDPAAPLFAFEAHTLVLCGFMPELAACVACGVRATGRTVAFAPARGGVLCPECAPAEAGEVEKIPAGARNLLDRLASGKLTKLDRVSISAPVARQTRAFLNRYESYVLGRELRTAKHL